MLSLGLHNHLVFCRLTYGCFIHRCTQPFANTYISQMFTAFVYLLHFRTLSVEKSSSMSVKRMTHCRLLCATHAFFPPPPS